ncbi:1-acyl-sn-glycerol-3-phosphate acyltransferase [candidate division KSB3 bacterium]|uniref:1-acyl-sn-glycerol-3-phosphate acyltransferase n=1 Tax=candidate division KSB3 bacterium TaxID=2044937 RepID=A0A2G6KAU7_9BACT|nr:MAG: 1-acyl-sn-glycerol-3-phosphate acyltransferase [candidate division KSB3 bacterium]
MLYKISQFFVRIFVTLYFRLKVEGLESVPKQGPYLIVANHASFLDPILIGAVVPRIIHYITYAFFYYHRAIHWYCKRVFCIPIKKEGNDIATFKKALRLLRQGELVGIFPEGARSHTGKLAQAQPGVALIALKAGVPIIPVGIRGTYEAFPTGARFPKPSPVTLTFGEPFSLDEFLASGQKPSGEVQVKAAERIMEKIAELCGQQAAPPSSSSRSHENNPTR